MKLFLPLLSAFALLAAGCAPIPTTIVHGATSARPSMPPPPVANNGAIYRQGGYRPLFEDAQARYVGDTLTITISENTTATKAASSSGSKNGAVSFTPPAVFGIFNGNAASTATKNSFSDADAASSSNTVTGSISVTVTEILPNGNLLVAGEKQLSLDKGTEYVRFSGVVSPATISFGNTVASSNVADARIEYRTNSQADRASVTAMLSRFFLSVLPF